jgi:YidC/Oxa1 family membrane protein insertase
MGKGPAASEGGAAAQTITLGDAGRGSADKLAVTINSRTAGIERVELNIKEYAETVKREKPLTLLQAVPGVPLPFSTLGIHFTVGNDTKELRHGVGLAEGATADQIAEANGRSVLETQYVWKVARQTATDVDLVMSFQTGGKPLAEVVKTFHVDPASYEITVSHAVHNLTDQPLKVGIDQLGAGDLPRDDPQMDDRVFHATGLNVAKKLVTPEFYNLAQLKLVDLPGGTQAVGQMNNYGATANPGPVLWVASSNRFFTAIVRPLPVTGEGVAAAAPFALADARPIPQVGHVAAAHVDVAKWAAKASDAAGVVRLTGAAMEVGPGATVTAPLAVYLGPKKREILQPGFVAKPADPGYAFSVYEYISVIQLSQGGCYAYCTWDWIARAILWLLNFFAHTVAFGNYGVAIMVLVIVVRALLHPLTRASQINMAVMGKKMKDVQPQLEAIKKKHATNKQKLNEEMMRVYRENNVNPAGGILGCLPMLIQMPIWAALWSGLRTDIDLRHAAFIPGWINDLSHPDTILPTALPVLGHPLFTLPLLGDIYGLNLLPLLLAGVFYFQMKVTTASQPKPADEQQAQMQKMSQYMIFLFPLFLYSAPSGLNLYIFASTLGGLVDTWLVRKTLKKRGILPATAQALPTHEEKA